VFIENGGKVNVFFVLAGLSGTMTAKRRITDFPIPYRFLIATNYYGLS